MPRFLFTAGAILVLCCRLAACTTVAADRPNIVLIMADDM